jgi:hypothetical protein
MPYGFTTFFTFTVRLNFYRVSSSVHTFNISHLYLTLGRNNISLRLLFFQISFPTNMPHTCHKHLLPCLQNMQELAALFVRWVTSAYPAVHRKVSAVCCEEYLNHWAKDMHMKDRWKVWCHMASLGWKGLRMIPYKLQLVQALSCDD